MGGGGESFSGGMMPGGALTNAVMGAPGTNMGLIGSTMQPNVMQQVAGGLGALGKQVQGMGMAAPPQGQGMTPMASPQVGQAPPLAHIWNEAFGPLFNPASAAAATLGRGY